MVKHLGIVGAGAMGAGMAQLAAVAGSEVSIYDVNDTVLRQALERLKQSLNNAAQKRELTAEQSTASFSRIHPRTHLTDLAHSDFIFEAALDDLRIKKDLFKHLETSTKPSTILAANTSFVSVTAIGSATHRGDKIVGFHFAAVSERAPLVEIVRTEQTSVETIRICRDFLTQLGKTSVVVADVPGFIMSRVVHPFHAEALRLLGEHVAEASQIDRIMKAEGGFAFGPFESLDDAGLDSALEVSTLLSEASSGDSRFRPHPILQRMVRSGLLGRKSGRGFYEYEREKK